MNNLEPKTAFENYVWNYFENYYRFANARASGKIILNLMNVQWKK